MRKTAVIIGAGPGGGAAAIRLQQLGVRDLVLIDKDRFPREKTCGSALSPNGLRILQSLGISAEVQRLGYLIRSLRIVTPGRHEMHLTTDQAAIVLLRKHFDNLLVEKACELGAEFRQGYKATSLIHENGRVAGVRVRSSDRTGEEEIRADYVLCADGAHSLFAWDPRPKRTISTLMGWWEDFPFEPHTMEMIFDKNLSPLYGWLFPENAERVNIGICIDGEEDAPGAREHDGRKKTTRNVREVFEQFLQDHFRERIAGARQIGKWKGHPISYTTWIRDCAGPGVLYLGEGARITHNATGEGIYQAMQSGIYAAEALAEVVKGHANEAAAWRRYTWRNRQRFTFGFLVGHVLRAALKTPLFDAIAIGYNNPAIQRLATWAVGSALAGSHVDAAHDTVSPVPAAAPTSAIPSVKLPDVKPSGSRAAAS
jgi:geranylgeranyl reductase family protein